MKAWERPEFGARRYHRMGHRSDNKTAVGSDQLKPVVFGKLGFSRGLLWGGSSETALIDPASVEVEVARMRKTSISSRLSISSETVRVSPLVK